ncbi:hypothetical protein MRX96_005374 [Rhipicephalus microplus]
MRAGSSASPLVDMAGKKAFTFELGFGCSSQQETIYNNCVRHIIDECFEGYNTVVLTYGENGSEKTCTRVPL